MRPNTPSMGLPTAACEGWCSASDIRSYPFTTAPDVLHIEWQSEVRDLVIRNFESEWGTTEERLCYYQVH